jgi:hypothetical protein
MNRFTEFSFATLKSELAVSERLREDIGRIRSRWGTAPSS